MRFAFLPESLFIEELKFSEELLLVPELASEEVRPLEFLNAALSMISSNRTSQFGEVVWKESSRCSVNLEGIVAVLFSSQDPLF